MHSGDGVGGLHLQLVVDRELYHVVVGGNIGFLILEIREFGCLVVGGLVMFFYTTFLVVDTT